MFDTPASFFMDRSVHALHSSDDMWPICRLEYCIITPPLPLSAPRRTSHPPIAHSLLLRCRRSRHPCRDLPGAAVVERRSASTLLGLFPVQISIANANSFSIPLAIDSKASINFALNRNLAPYVFVYSRWFTFSRFLGHHFTSITHLMARGIMIHRSGECFFPKVVPT